MCGAFAALTATADAADNAATRLCAWARCDTAPRHLPHTLLHAHYLCYRILVPTRPACERGVPPPSHLQRLHLSLSTFSANYFCHLHYVPIVTSNIVHGRLPPHACYALVVPYISRIQLLACLPQRLNRQLSLLNIGCMPTFYHLLHTGLLNLCSMGNRLFPACPPPAVLCDMVGLDVSISLIDGLPRRAPHRALHADAATHTTFFRIHLVCAWRLLAKRPARIHACHCMTGYTLLRQLAAAKRAARRDGSFAPPFHCLLHHHTCLTGCLVARRFCNN